MKQRDEAAFDELFHQRTKKDAPSPDILSSFLGDK